MGCVHPGSGASLTLKKKCKFPTAQIHHKKRAGETKVENKMLRFALRDLPPVSPLLVLMLAE